MKKTSVKIGDRYGRLTVIARVPDIRKTYWICKCDCGKTTTVYTTKLVVGKTKSCGCAHLTHGMSHDCLYHIWTAKRTKGTCPEWEDYMTFREWAIKHDWVEGGCVIGRINKNKPFSPDNCYVYVPLALRKGYRHDI